jgi:hypothetical protein
MYLRTIPTAPVAPLIDHAMIRARLELTARAIKPHSSRLIGCPRLFVAFLLARTKNLSSQRLLMCHRTPQSIDAIRGLFILLEAENARSSLPGMFL